ncbi:MAG: DNA starvation/stationary phase protection protein [Pseudomonadota bacterium]
MTSSVLNMKVDIEHPQTGIDDKHKIASNMAACLADSYFLMVKTQGYHWNAVGPMFYSIHNLTEEHYTNLFEAIDDLAERMRALGYPAPTSITEMVSATVLQEDVDNSTTEAMVDNLARDHEICATRFRECVERAEAVKDVVTADMLTERIAFHEKAVWMLRATLTQ